MIKTPYPWFGGKSSIAPEVWQRFGRVNNYVEPFFGGGGMLLGAPWPAQRVETVNDLNAWLTNFWRAVQADPDTVAAYASDPVSELDLHARGDALFYKGVRLDENRVMLPDEFVEQMRLDPDWYDSKIAGWWVWGQGAWIGDNWGRRECRAMPHLGNVGTGVHQQGVGRQRPHIGNRGTGIHAGATSGTPKHERILAYLRELSARVSDVRICCGDWRRVLGPSPTFKVGMTAVFLDPPYAVEDRESVYGEHEDRSIAHDVREWAIENGDNPLLRIALCGYADEHSMPDSWDCWAWKAQGGYENQAEERTGNKYRERVWFSPHCLGQQVLDF